MACTALSVHATDYTCGLSIWFDTPNTLVNKAVWFGNTPDMWKGENKPESTGDTATNPDAGWESQSLPIGNGSLGANIMGSVEAERITFNEKTLWRGGPNTSAGATAYWNVNKPSAHILDEIRQALALEHAVREQRQVDDLFHEPVSPPISRSRSLRSSRSVTTFFDNSSRMDFSSGVSSSSFLPLVTSSKRFSSATAASIFLVMDFSLSP